MKVSDTRAAFSDLISQRAIHKELGLNSPQIRNYRQRIANGDWPSEDLMAQLLDKAGYTRITPARWSPDQSAADKLDDLREKLYYSMQVDLHWTDDMKQLIEDILFDS